MTDTQNAPGADAAVIRSLCEEARSLASGLKGPVSRLRLAAGDHAVEIEWQLAAPAGAPAAAPQAGGAAPTVSEEPTAGGDGGEEHHPIVAPLLGTFYRSPEPGAKPFVEEGDVVEAGQDVAIVEAMKIMNRVQADRAGRVVKIVVDDGEMVEFGQELMLLEPFDAGA